MCIRHIMCSDAKVNILVKTLIYVLIICGRQSCTYSEDIYIQQGNIYIDVVSYMYMFCRSFLRNAWDMSNACM